MPLVAQLRLAGVHRHPHPQLGARRPRLGCERSLGVERRGDGVGGPAERADDAVTLALLDRTHPAVRDDRLVEQLVVRGDGDRHRLRRRLPPRVDPSTSVSRNVTVPVGRANARVHTAAHISPVPQRPGEITTYIIDHTFRVDQQPAQNIRQPGDAN